MPAGDPAGYLPNVRRNRLKRLRGYKKRRGPMKPSIPSPTGGVQGPPPMRPRTGSVPVPLPQKPGGRDGYVPRAKRQKGAIRMQKRARAQALRQQLRRRRGKNPPRKLF